MDEDKEKESPLKLVVNNVEPLRGFLDIATALRALADKIESKEDGEALQAAIVVRFDPTSEDRGDLSPYSIYSLGSGGIPACYMLLDIGKLELAQMAQDFNWRDA